jgi:hypothetical protein
MPALSTPSEASTGSKGKPSFVGVPFRGLSQIPISPRTRRGRDGVEPLPPCLERFLHHPNAPKHQLSQSAAGGNKTRPSETRSHRVERGQEISPPSPTPTRPKLEVDVWGRQGRGRLQRMKPPKPAPREHKNESGRDFSRPLHCLSVRVASPMGAEASRRLRVQIHSANFLAPPPKRGASGLPACPW